MNKAVFIIPGFGQTTSQKSYQKITEIIKKEGFSPILVNIKWNNSLTDSTKYFLKIYKKIHSKKKYILGFSYGAMIAFIAASKVRTSGLILCSLSPYFRENPSPAIAKRVKTKQVFMLYGTEESKTLIKQVRTTFEQISAVEKHLIPVLQTDHRIGDKKYLIKIHEAARTLL
jgi:alpha/beta superfamily hydrolase